MKKATARVSTYASTWAEAEEKVDALIKKFLELDDEQYAKVRDKLELTIHLELASAETISFFADANFRIPSSD